MKKLPYLIISCCLLLATACGKSDSYTPPAADLQEKCAFYHWKVKAKSTDEIESALQQCQTRTIYLHYFDVTTDEKEATRRAAHPTYVLREIGFSDKNYDIIPTIFITNQAMKMSSDIPLLKEQIQKLIDQISLHHFRVKHRKIQIDCDWTESTRDDFFKLIRFLKEDYEVSVTIRLHQIKYQGRTGVPPVDRGALMLYNVGQIGNMQQNSILEKDIVADYIHAESTYPIPLDIALPLFSQTVIQNNRNDYRLVKGTQREVLETDKIHFTQVSENVFEVKKDTLFQSFYLYEGFQIKLEELSEKEIISSYNIVKNSKLNVGKTIFYHLDNDVLQNINLNELILSL